MMKISDKQVKELHKKYIENDKTLKEIIEEEELDIHYTTLSKRFVELFPSEHQTKGPRRKLSDNKIEQIYNDYMNNFRSITTLAKENNINKSTIYYGFRKLNLPLREKKASDELMKKLHHQYMKAEDKTLKDMANKINATESYLSLRFKELNLETKGNGNWVAVKNKSERSKRKEEARENRCNICKEERLTQCAHIKHRRNGGTWTEDNIVFLCPTHHRLYDRGKLNKEEREKLIEKYGTKVFEEHDGLPY